MSEPIKWTNVTLKLSQLKKWENNPAEISKEAAGRLVECFNEFGQIETLAVDPENRLVDGHQRLDTWLAKYGDIEVDCRKASRLLTEKERQKIAVMLRSGAVGRYNWDVVSSWSADDLQGWGMDSATLKEWKHDVSALDNFIESEKKEPVDAEPQIDRAAELNEKWQVKTGDLWQIGEHRLLCGDSTVKADVDRVMGGEKATVVFTDPPYNMETQGGGALHEQYKKTAERIKDIVDFKPAEFLATLNLYFASGYHSSFIFCNKALILDYLIFAKENKLSANILVWKKPVCVPFGDSHRPDIEYLIFIRKNAKWINGLSGANYSRCLEYPNERSEEHPTIKPVELVQNQLRITSETNDVIAEPFCGSGTTMVACENLHRKCRAIEISPNYCAVILERMSVAFPELEIIRL
jgi:site-specific DNA-methyltransferase (adenine-specific)